MLGKLFLLENVNMTMIVDKELKNSVDNLFKNLETTNNSTIYTFLRQCERDQSLFRSCSF